MRIISIALIIGIQIGTATAHEGWFARICPARTEADRIYLQLLYLVVEQRPQRNRACTARPVSFDASTLCARSDRPDSEQHLAARLCLHRLP